MKTATLLFRCAALGVAMLVLVAGHGTVRAQPSNEPSAAKSDEFTQAELLKANLHLQEQLHAAQLAIERIRIESQESARAQAAIVTDKLNAIQSTLEAERQRRQDEMQRSNRTLLWVASAFGGVGLLAMLLTALFQWRAVSRMAEVAALRPQLAGPVAAAGLLPAETGGPVGRTVEMSNQRLLSVIDRLERRVIELEHTPPRPLPATPVPEGATETAPVSEPVGLAARITVLLGKGQSLLNAEKPEEALACYDEILRLDGNHPEALVKKGAALERLKQDEAALRCYDRAIAADGSLTIAYLYKGGIYNRLERYNEALECYEQALRAQGGTA